MLTNIVVPSGLGGKQRNDIVVPHGVVERAQLGLELLKSSVYELVKANQKGLLNSDVASMLGLRSDYQGNQKDYLSYSILGLLMREGRVDRIEGNRPRHIAK